MKKFRLRLIGILSLVLILFSSWGYLVHRTVTQLAIYQLPGEIQGFFYRSKAALVKTSIRPDERRNRDPSEDPKHFIDGEAYGDSALWKMPYSWNRAVAKYTRDTLHKYGYLPYWVMVMKERLTGAFRKKNKDSILYYAADIGHYIADAHVPLHTTLNYDGQLTGQKGLHSVWESTIPEIELNKYQLYNAHEAKYLKNAEGAIWTTVRQSFSMVDGLLREEKLASKGFTNATKYRIQMRNGKEVRSYSTAFARAYSKRVGKAINQQLLKSSNMIADFWFTCWVDAGRPNLNSLQQTLTTKERSRLLEEQEAYKNNLLLKKKVLLARQDKESAKR